MFDITQTFEADLSAMNPDQVLDHLINLRRIKADLEAADAKALDRLDELADAGEIDRASFSHNDWGISWSAGKASYVYPADVQEFEKKLKAAKEAAKAEGTATKATGKPFWTIKRPGS
jgi:uncharacterized protein (DUF849 family)